MSGCGCSFTPVENKETEEIKYTDALAEQFAAEVGVDPRPNETLVEIDERGAFIRQPNAFIQPFFTMSEKFLSYGTADFDSNTHRLLQLILS